MATNSWTFYDTKDFLDDDIDEPDTADSSQDTEEDFDFREWYNNFQVKIKLVPSIPEINQPETFRIQQARDSINIPVSDLEDLLNQLGYHVTRLSE